MDLLDKIRGAVKGGVRSIAYILDKATHSRLTPNQVTFTGLVMHLPIVWFIMDGQVVLAAILLIFFGLFDTLDGELARLQKRTTATGMFFDSATDRIKEILLYIGITAYLFNSGDKYIVMAIVGALGASLCTSYLNAWGEAVLAQQNHIGTHKVNKTFRNGLLSFDLRIVLIIIGLLTDRLGVIIYIILVLATITVLQRFISISARLKNVQN